MDSKVILITGALTGIGRATAVARWAWRASISAPSARTAIMEQLSNASGTLKKLSFSVARVANVEQWASEAEDGLIDLRKAGAFRGKGTLLQKANEVLKATWETGDAAAVRTTMAEFRRLYQKELLDHSPVRSARSQVVADCGVGAYRRPQHHSAKAKQ